MNIGFDLDKIFINHPPLVPEWVIAKLYGEKANGHLTYRMPGKFEQYIRQLSHTSFLRPSIGKNIEYLKKIKKTRKINLYLISSRFSFLQKQTHALVKKYSLDKIFHQLYFNFNDEQPHEFKERIINQLHIDRYVDDDLPLLRYLEKKLPKIQLFWLNNKENGKMSQHIIAITHIASVFENI